MINENKSERNKIKKIFSNIQNLWITTLLYLLKFKSNLFRILYNLSKLETKSVSNTF